LFPFCGEGDLFDHLCSCDEHLTEAEIRRIVRNVIKGIDFMLERGDVHRDVIHQNIRVRDGVEQASLCNLGLSDETRYSQEAVGSLPSLAPEIALRSPKYEVRCEG
jgi:serine/threonine protein kinase